jgi:hypothetical protein
MMKFERVLFIVAICAIGFATAAGAQDNPPNNAAEPSAVTQVRARYQAAEKAAQEAEAAVAPLRTAVQQADAAYAEVKKAADTKRRQADEAKRLAGDQGIQALKEAEAAVAAAIQTLADATAAKPPLDEAVAEAKAAALPLQEAYDTAEQAAQEADTAARIAANAARQLERDAETAEAEAAAKRRAAGAAKFALAQAQQLLESLQQTATADAKPARDNASTKETPNETLATAEERVAETLQLQMATEQAALDAAEAAKAKRQLATQATALRQAVVHTATTLAQAQKAKQRTQKQMRAAAEEWTKARAERESSDLALAHAQQQVASAKETLATAKQNAQEAAEQAEKCSADPAKSDAEKQQAVAAAAAKQQLAADAAERLSAAQSAVQQAQVQLQATTQRLRKARTRKETGAEALAAANERLAAANTANQSARKAAQELLELDTAARQAAAEAAAKRKLANQAKAELAPKAKALEDALLKANAAAQALTRAENRKKSTEKALEDLRKRIAAAKQTHETDEVAAQQAEAAAAPLKQEAERHRTAFLAARDVASQKRKLAQQAKSDLYQLVAAKRIADIMEDAATPQPANRIDELVFAKLDSLGIQPALCSDAVFVRRVHLDLTGQLPTANEARTFIQDADTNKRVALVDRLLEEPAHFDYWAMKWCDILRVKAEFPVKVWPNAAQAYHRWIWSSIADNKPYDVFARELLTSSGSNFRVGPVNFYRAIQNKTPEGIAAAVGLAFMGTRTHLWPEERRAGMATFFSQVGYKPTSEWKEEIVFWDPLNSTAITGSIAPGIDNVAQSVTASNQIPQMLDKPLDKQEPLAATFPDGSPVTIPPDRDPRSVFADWLIRAENPWFARAAVNRTWAWAMGRGIVHEPDDMRDDNPPSNPELLDYLAAEFVASGYDLKHIRRLILTSTTYQFSPILKSETPEARANFAGYPLRRVEAEVLNDAINSITGSSDLITSAVPEPFTYIPQDMNAVEVADGSITSPFLTLFGRSARATGMENERVNELASPQWLYMLNSGQIQRKLQNGPRLKTIVSSGRKPIEIAEELYLTILSRFPTEADIRAVQQYAKTGVAKGRNLWIDVAWALVNNPEFLLRH